MITADALRAQIEAKLADRIPSALSPTPRTIRPLTATGIPNVDDLLEGGLPVGAITEIVGPECSGRTSFALNFIARITQTAKVVAWVDVSDALDPESVAAAGVDLNRFLWVRCGVQTPTNPLPPPQMNFSLPEKYLIPPSTKKSLHGGGFGPHPRSEVKGLSNAIGGFLRPDTTAPRCAEPQRRRKTQREIFEPTPRQQIKRPVKPTPPSKPWSRIDQALQVTDLLLQAGGFSSTVLDMGSIAPEFASRVPLATWFRYRTAAERTQTTVLLLTQHACAKSSAGLVLRLHPGHALQEESTVFTGIEHFIEVERERLTPTATNVIPLRKQPQRESVVRWRSRTPWAGRQ